jgi:hypothetical protein
MKSAVLVATAVAVLACASSVNTLSQSKKQKKMPSQAEMMKRWQESMTPGEPHKMLEKSVGTWETEAKTWMAGPDSVPTVTKGNVERKMVLGGRYLCEEYSGDMMGSPFSGIGYTGYDNFKKKFVGTWMDNMSTGVATMEGTLDKSGKQLTMWGKMDDPMTGEKDKKVKYVTKYIDDDHSTFEVYDVTAYGDKKPTMVITYTRKAK